MKIVIEKLKANKEKSYLDFSSKLIPNVDKERFLGVRTPILRKMAKEMIDDGSYESFLLELPHYYIEENTLHGIILSNLKIDINKLLNLIDDFLPYVDNWSTCDLINPKIFKKYPELVHNKIKEWLRSKKIYTTRFAIDMLLGFYLDERFSPKDLVMISKIKTNEYYVKMAISWYYSFALIKQYDETILLFESKTLDRWIQNKSITKAIESYRISIERKDYLRTLKIK